MLARVGLVLVAIGAVVSYGWGSASRAGFGLEMLGAVLMVLGLGALLAAACAAARHDGRRSFADAGLELLGHEHDD